MSGLSIGDEVRVDREGDMNDGHQGVITDRFISDTYGNKRVVYEVEFEEVTTVDINVGHYFPDELKEE